MRRSGARRLAPKPLQAGRRTGARNGPLRDGGKGLRRIAPAGADQTFGGGVSAAQTLVHNRHAALSDREPRRGDGVFDPDGRRPARTARRLEGVRKNTRIPDIRLSPPRRAGRAFRRTRHRAGGCSAAGFLLNGGARTDRAGRGRLADARRGSRGVHPPQRALEPGGAQGRADGADRRGTRKYRTVRRARQTPLPAQRVGRGAQRLQPQMVQEILEFRYKDIYNP